MSTMQYAIGFALGVLAFAIVAPVIFLLIVKWTEFVADKILGK
jgi:hypothetical protein